MAGIRIPNVYNHNSSITKYIVLNEPRTGSSWLQEISQMHPGVKVQFELDMAAGDAALSCRQCHRPTVPNSKNPSRVPPKLHPPMACGMTVFGSSNRLSDVGALAGRHNASLVVVLRRNHLAHAVSAYLHFNQPKGRSAAPRDPLTGRVDLKVPWDAQQLRRAVEEQVQAYHRLLEIPAAAPGSRAHLIFYEDMKADPAAVWRRLQTFLGLPHVQLQNISQLERRSTARPSAHYLQHLGQLREELNGTSVGEMLHDEYDAGMGRGVAAEFARVCAGAGAAELSWRGGRCELGRAVPWDDEPAEAPETTTTPPPPSWIDRLRDLWLPPPPPPSGSPVEVLLTPPPSPPVSRPAWVKRLKSWLCDQL